MFRYLHIQFRRFMHQPGQIAIGIQAIFLGRFNQAVDDGAGFRAPGHVGEQEVLAAHHKGLDAAFSPVVADLQPAILQAGDEPGPLLACIACSLAQQRLGPVVDPEHPVVKLLQKGRCQLPARCKPLTGRQILDLTLDGKQSIAIPLPTPYIAEACPDTFPRCPLRLPHIFVAHVPSTRPP